MYRQPLDTSSQSYNDDFGSYVENKLCPFWNFYSKQMIDHPGSLYSKNIFMGSIPLF